MRFLSVIITSVFILLSNNVFAQTEEVDCSRDFLKEKLELNRKYNDRIKFINKSELSSYAKSKMKKDEKENKKQAREAIKKAENECNQ